MRIPLISSIKAFPRRFGSARGSYSKPGDTGGDPWAVTDPVRFIDLSGYLKIDGSRAMIGNLNMGFNWINNLMNPIGAQDAVTKAYADHLHRWIMPSGASEPALPQNFQLFYNTTDQKIKFYNGADWLVVLKLDADENALIAGRYLKE